MAVQLGVVCKKIPSGRGWVTKILWRSRWAVKIYTTMELFYPLAIIVDNSLIEHNSVHKNDLNV